MSDKPIQVEGLPGAWFSPEEFKRYKEASEKFNKYRDELIWGKGPDCHHLWMNCNMTVQGKTVMRCIRCAKTKPINIQL